MDAVTRVLLLGAGFSKNWGGWLAKNLFGKLAGHPLVDGDPVIKRAVWHQRKNFEDALAYLRDADPGRALKFETAISDAFHDMNRAFVGEDVPRFPLDHPTCVWLAKFHAIFTLNQDLLVEGSYIAREVALLSSFPKWAGADIPGMVPDPKARRERGDVTGPMIREDDLNCASGYQPYYKLHGSANWRDVNGRQMLVVGSKKSGQIAADPLFSHYKEQFDDYLTREPCRLLVIGYGFRDDHINETIEKAAEGGGLRMFIVDPLGVEATRGEHQRVPGAVNDGVNSQEVPFQDIILGESTDSIRLTLEGKNDNELSKINSFLMLSRASSEL
jgi:hypothetical protein